MDMLFKAYISKFLKYFYLFLSYVISRAICGNLFLKLMIYM